MQNISIKLKGLKYLLTILCEGQEKEIASGALGLESEHLSGSGSISNELCDLGQVFYPLEALTFSSKLTEGG